ncbi:MAG: Rieske 2Fe-2S domain-containing protein [Nocardioidaceae bacterium]|nr:Rieske 2Fe-2S domain-containing protein [Nocardioidaceae bacterium]
MSETATRRSEPVSAARRQFDPYTKAVWGLMNHWYPAFFSSELGEDEAKGIKVCGIPVILRRANGEVFALRDQCAHRGVRMSIRPACFTKDTLTCWYHGFTYDLETGKLVTIVAAPDDPIVGDVKLQTFPVREKNGIIYVFVGDDGYEPVPDLAEDLPPKLPADYPHQVPHLLDDDAVVLGIRRTVASNWRLGVENGFDPGHNWLHRDSPIVVALDTALPLGLVPRGPNALTTFEGDGPKGIRNEWDSGDYDVVMSSEKLGLQARGANKIPGLRTSIFLPGVLMVEHWPAYGLAQYEWYVPIDDEHHEYWAVVAKSCPTPAERTDFEYAYDKLWRDAALGAFNDDDLFAREAMENFYAEGGTGWDDEQLCGMDAVIVGWRKIVSRYARGYQTPQAHPTPKNA